MDNQDEIRLSDPVLNNELDNDSENESDMDSTKMPVRIATEHVITGDLLEAINDHDAGASAKSWLQYLTKPYQEMRKNPISFIQAKRMDIEAIRHRNDLWDTERKNSDQWSDTEDGTDSPLHIKETAVILKVGINEVESPPNGLFRRTKIIGWKKPIRKLQWPLIPSFDSQDERCQAAADQVLHTMMDCLNNDEFPFPTPWKLENFPSHVYTYSNLNFGSCENTADIFYRRTSPTPHFVKPHIFYRDGIEFIEYLATFDIVYHSEMPTKLHKQNIKIIAEQRREEMMKKLSTPTTTAATPAAVVPTKQAKPTNPTEKTQTEYQTNGISDNDDQFRPNNVIYYSERNNNNRRPQQRFMYQRQYQARSPQRISMPTRRYINPRLEGDEIVVNVLYPDGQTARLDEERLDLRTVLDQNRKRRIYPSQDRRRQF